MLPERAAQLFAQSPVIERQSALTNDELRSVDTYLQGMLQSASSAVTKTHYFHGRYENIYLDSSAAGTRHAVLDRLLAESLNHCAEMLQVDRNELKIGFWFNQMEPGQVTSLHRHDDYDELVSAVVYLKVPDHSGDLILEPGNGEAIPLAPVPGRYFYFSPEMPHRVGENRSSERRLSIGMNIGPRMETLDHA